MQRLNDMPTSELITTARNYSASIKEIGVYSELVKQLTDRLAFSTAATSQALVERADLHREVTAYEATVTNLEAQVQGLAAEGAALKNALEWLYETVSSDSVSIPDEKYSAVTNAAQALSEAPSTDAALAEIRNEALAEGVAPLVKALTVIANSEEIDGDTVVCDFSTLVSVAAGALRDHYAQQLRKEQGK